ncbi:MAG: efflux transporter outer membrane subunit [Methylomonas sp.]|nr:efflux transporter outer membrane subunit [Methylomonas sp.]PPD20899.1 MAG: RND transporter [Methylomonas sp.]PPD25599.1 MAG: RND transporter [Methylomonas sp.]PPD36600.1 MAG: RND transporter [Methylomonas sp.]PPD39931.1 MAG: RND transporter [Methylomonas sp.]
MKRAGLTMAVSAFLTTACNLMPDFVLDSGHLPDQWRNAEHGVTDSPIAPGWWQTFGSQELDQLITEALQYNNDLAAATQRIEQARAQTMIAGAELWPILGADANMNSTHNELGESRRRSGNVTLAYEVDLWGANRGRRDAGQARYLSEVFAREALQLVVMADVSSAYFALLATAERKRITESFMKNTEDIMLIVESRFQAGAVSALAVAQQQTEVANARANVDLVTQQQALAENTLAILLGRPPVEFNVRRQHFSDLTLPVVPSQQPLTLLQRRPDLRQAEMSLQAANLEVGIALAQFFPRLTINLDTLLANPQPAGVALAMAAGLAQPLFQGGRLEGGLASAKARNAELVERYQQSLLVAFKEVEDAAAVRNHSSQRLQALNEAVTRAREAYIIARDQYRVGAVDYQALLITQRSLLNSETAQVQARLDVLQALVQLYRAFGGGWQG